MLSRKRKTRAESVNRHRPLALRTARRIAKLSQLGLARKAHVDPSIVCRLENGDRRFAGASYETIARIAQALNVTAEELFPVDDGDPESEAARAQA